MKSAESALNFFLLLLSSLNRWCTKKGAYHFQQNAGATLEGHVVPRTRGVLLAAMRLGHFGPRVWQNFLEGRSASSALSKVQTSPRPCALGAATC